MRGTTRRAAAAEQLDRGAGRRRWWPIRTALATLVPHLAGRVGGLLAARERLGAARAPSLHGVRLETLLEHIVDTPVRGLVYEAAGSVADGLLAGEGLVARGRASAGGSRPWS